MVFLSELLASSFDDWYDVGCFSVKWNKVPDQEALGDFELLIDEDLVNLNEDLEYGERFSSKY